MGGVGLQSLISAWTDQQPAFWTVDLGTHQLEKKNNNIKYTQIVSVTVEKTAVIEQSDWFIERIQTRVAFDWISERSGEKTSCPRTFQKSNDTSL